MISNLLNSRDAATRIGVATQTLYEWLTQSVPSDFEICGQRTTILYFPRERKGLGRIKISSTDLVSAGE
jgi:hypothetical protein